METSTLTFIISIGLLLFNVGFYFGYVKGKFTDYDQLSIDFYDHEKDETKHFSERDWKNLENRLDKIEHGIDELRALILKQ